MRTKLAVFLAGLALVALAVPAVAHHAVGAEYDASKVVKLTGTVSKVEWTNPHARIYFDVKDADGKVTTWMIEGGSPNQLIRMGVTKNSVPVGTELMIDAYMAKDGTNKAVGRDFTFNDGRRLFLGGSAPGATPDADKK